MNDDQEVCPACSGCGFLTDGWTEGVAFQRQTCTTDEQCPRCDGKGRVPYVFKTAKKDTA